MSPSCWSANPWQKTAQHLGATAGSWALDPSAFPPSLQLPETNPSEPDFWSKQTCPPQPHFAPFNQGDRSDRGLQMDAMAVAVDKDKAKLPHRKSVAWQHVPRTLEPGGFGRAETRSKNALETFSTAPFPFVHNFCDGLQSLLCTSQRFVFKIRDWVWTTWFVGFVDDATKYRSRRARKPLAMLSVGNGKHAFKKPEALDQKAPSTQEIAWGCLFQGGWVCWFFFCLCWFFHQTKALVLFRRATALAISLLQMSVFSLLSQQF